MRKYFDIIKIKYQEHYEKVNSVYKEYRFIFLFLIIAAFCFQAVDKLQSLRNYYFNQETFDLNEVPEGTVVWIYPKNKNLHAVQPDSLKIKNLTTDITSLNYNVDTWVVAIHTSRDQIVKIEVPDYAISYFKIGSLVGRPINK